MVRSVADGKEDFAVLKGNVSASMYLLSSYFTT